MNDRASASDDEKFASYGQALLDAVSAAIRPWLTTVMTRRVGSIDAELDAAIEHAAKEVERSIATLVAADVDEPLSGPLERIRQGIEPLNTELDRRGVARPSRDAVDREMRPLDTHELGPMTFRDLGDEVHEAGITWGAAKAHLHLKRRQAL